MRECDVTAMVEVLISTSESLAIVEVFISTSESLLGKEKNVLGF